MTSEGDETAVVRMWGPIVEIEAVGAVFKTGREAIVVDALCLLWCDALP